VAHDHRSNHSARSTGAGSAARRAARQQRRLMRLALDINVVVSALLCGNWGQVPFSRRQPLSRTARLSRVMSQSRRILAGRPGPMVSEPWTGMTVVLPSACRRKWWRPLMRRTMNPARPERCNQVAPGRTRKCNHAAMVTRWTPMKSSDSLLPPSTSRYSSMASRMRSINASKDLA